MYTKLECCNNNNKNNKTNRDKKTKRKIKLNCNSNHKNGTQLPIIIYEMTESVFLQITNKLTKVDTKYTEKLIM